MVISIVYFKEELGEKVLALGMLIGSLIQLLLLVIVAARLKILKFAKPDCTSQNAIMMFKQVPCKGFLWFSNGINPCYRSVFCGSLVIGSIAALNYGFKLPAFFTTILIIALGIVLLPYFSKTAIDEPKKAFKNLFWILKWTFLVLISLMLVASFFSNEIVSLLFERNNFTSSDTEIVSQIQIIF